MGVHLHVSVVYAVQTTKKQLNCAGINVNADESTYPDVAVGRTSTALGTAYYLWVRESYRFIASSDGDERNNQTGVLTVREVAPAEVVRKYERILRDFCDRLSLQCLHPEWVITRKFG